LPGCSSKNNDQTYGTPSGLKGAAATSAIAGLASPETPIFQVSGADALASGDSAAAASVSGGGTPPGPGPCLFDPSGGQFACPDPRKGNLNLTRRVTFRDAAGNVQSAFDKDTTESIEVETSADGTMNRPGGGTVTIHRTGDMTTSGLSGAETTRILNGTEQGTIDGTWTLPDGTSASEHTTISDSTNNLVIPARPKGDGTTPNPMTPPPNPLSGSRTHSTTTTGTKGGQTKTTTMSRTETFDGTSIVQVVLTLNGQTKNCTVDLANHTSTCGNK
jgi:hypothetical protein